MTQKDAFLSTLWSRAYILLTIAAFGWAGNAIVGRAARDVVPPLALSFWRWFIAMLIILPFAYPHLRRDWARLRESWKVVLLMGVLGIGAFNSFLYTGLTSTTAVNALLIQSSQPAMILALGALIMGDRIGRWQIVSLFLSLLGVATILTHGHLEVLLGLRLHAGDAVIGLAVVAWGFYSILLRKRPIIHPLSFLAATIIIGVLAISPFAAAEWASGHRPTWGWEAFGAIAYVGVIPSLISYLLFNRGVELLGSGQAGLYMNIMPVIGAGLAILFLGEAFHLYHLAGLLLVLVGIGAARRGV